MDEARPLGGRHSPQLWFVGLLTCSVLLILLAPQLSDIVAIRERELAGVDHPFEYGVLARGLYLALVAVAGSPDHLGWFTALVGVGAAVAVAVVLGRGGADRRVWMLSPSLLLVGQNIDAVVALTIAAALAGHVQGRRVSTGVMVGLGAGLKFVPGLLAPPLSLVRRGWLVVAGAAAVWLTVNAPVLAFRRELWLEPFRFARERDDVRGTIWAVTELRGASLSVASSASLAAALLLVLWLVHRERLTPLGGVALSLSSFLLVSPVYQPHYVLWLLPVVAFLPVDKLALRVFEVANLAYFLALWAYLPLSWGTGLWFTSIPRLAALVWVAHSVLVADPMSQGRKETSVAHLPGS